MVRRWSAQANQTASTFNYYAGSSDSYYITVVVTDRLGVTSPQSIVASVTVSASPTVSTVPVGPLSLDVGQIRAFTPTASGGFWFSVLSVVLGRLCCFWRDKFDLFFQLVSWFAWE
ncbi:MAG: hypothetical protein ABSF65_12340 [Candidatus Bathyarchaeia archaeon]